jgi:prepilin-type N-terminal cleavage/methylation domain-containing protein/prepilin-type processing-associated H-X9-DG protein
MTNENPVQQLSVRRRSKAKAFTLVELLVVITIATILAGLILSAISVGKAHAKQTVCLSNERQLVMALIMYSDSDSQKCFGGTENAAKNYPYVNENWLRRYEKLPANIFFCPATRNGEVAENYHRLSDDDYFDLSNPAMDATHELGFSYDLLLWFADMEDFWNGNRNSIKNSRFVIKTQSSIENYAHANEAFDMKGRRFGPSRIWLLTDNAAIMQNIFWPAVGRNHGAAGANSAFADGHVEWIPRLNYVYQYEASQDNNRTRATPRPNL